jgi:hypothetical protein
MKSRNSVDNFVENLSGAALEAPSIKASAGLPMKKANLKSHTNQALAIAMGFGAGTSPKKWFCRSAPQILCISGAAGNYFFLAKAAQRA